ncbi:MAG: UDP-N-acetylmuramoyl-L-alanyl-D-glutamate--2,6-diaminopimelate ligase [Candidatus Dependentiae bacterium]|nr:UDP-N-acetylmuramoyl-L-alanyl-D-glutamate--2,6-diaminopimelate ligase [Candidatus Dependentiae bacterium]
MDQNHAHNIPFPFIFPVTCHTDHVGLGSTFVVIQGFKTDGLLYVPLALERGASGIVVQHDVCISDSLQALINYSKAEVIRVADTRKALAALSAHAADYPADKLTIVGITGTKGKTTTAFLLKHIFSQAGYRTALLSTAGNQIAGEKFPATLTTAQPDYLHQFLKTCVDRGITHVVMEVAAQAVTLNRVKGILFDGIIFTNFGLEHLEFYDTLDSYFAAKCALLAHRKGDAPIYLNADNEWCARLVKKYKSTVTFGVAAHADNRICGIEPRSLRFELCTKNTIMQFECPALSGTFNAYNVAACVSLLLDKGVAPDIINQALACFAGVPGRFERHHLSNGALAIIDYAHNPLSYQALLPELRVLTNHLIVVFGAGGERDASRRPLMGALAAEFADRVVVTSDNPRSEDAGAIAEDICAGIAADLKNKVVIELDRHKAIEKAFSLSDAGSVIAVLGKGPDCYQIIGSTKTDFNEVAILAAL